MPQFPDLAIEVQVHILTFASAKEVQLARAICREFRDLIDANESQLALTIQQRSAAAITSNFYGFFPRSGTPDFLDFLDKVVTRGGIWQNSSSMKWLMVMDATDVWCRRQLQCSDREADALTHEERKVWHNLMYAAFALVQLHSSRHLQVPQPGPSEPRCCCPSTLEGYLQSVDTTYSEPRFAELLNVEKLSSWWSTVYNTPGGFFKAAVVSDEHPSKPRPLTNLRYNSLSRLR